MWGEGRRAIRKEWATLGRPGFESIRVLGRDRSDSNAVLS
jgi:hypothetical protein